LICEVDVLERLIAGAPRAAGDEAAGDAAAGGAAADATADALDVVDRLRPDFPHLVPAIVCSHSRPDPAYASACAAADWPTPIHTPTADDAARVIASQLALALPIDTGGADG
ncbi:MAG: hypothetical protein EA382_16340, partial [Spirochaetaceae bacterium]